MRFSNGSASGIMASSGHFIKGITPSGAFRRYDAVMHGVSQRNTFVRWLKELTAIPTAAGKEDRVISWVKRWVEKRRNLQWREDRAGNLLITRRGTRQRRHSPRPLFITAHLDHPAFVVRRVIDDRAIELEFRGGVHDPYFLDARIDMFDENDRRHRAEILGLDASAKPFKRVTARLKERSGTIRPGDVARWAFDTAARKPHVKNGLLHAPACDDLAGVAAALAAIDLLRNRNRSDHVGVLLTRAEEVGFIGAIAACKHRSVPRNARLICLENSRSFAESPIGGGPILRVGDKTSVFHPELTNRIGLLMTEYQKTHPEFTWQRRLMPGGTCEATAFSAFGYESTCLCLPLGNYHNMTDIDGVLAGRRPARVAPEFIALADFHGLIHMLVLCATNVETARASSLTERMNRLFRQYRRVLRT